MMQNDYIHIILADDDEDDRLFFTDAFNELSMNTKVNTFNDGFKYAKKIRDRMFE